MKIYPREPDLSSICTRIQENNIILQPDFQRDLIWNTSKKQSLIDTILRNWQFPPIFVVVNEHSKLEVLDGQQRLNAIYEFYNDQFPIDGYINPIDNNIIKLHGLRYSLLPRNIRSNFDRFSIRVFELYEYNSDEPYELFFRLNQGTSLTPAEKRNTLFGDVRSSVRELARIMDSYDINSNSIGFNNSRLSYHDVLARLIFALKNGLSKKITDAMLVDFFRNGYVPTEAKYAANTSIEILSKSITKKIRLNKSTLFTWLYFFSVESSNSATLTKINIVDSFHEVLSETKNFFDQFDSMTSFIFNLYLDKSSSSVNDATPVQIRLLILYFFCIIHKIDFESKRLNTAKSIFNSMLNSRVFSEEQLIAHMINNKWGLIA
jgi:hypothetical protein